MIEVALDNSSGIRVEVCRICEFVWFDAGETQSLQVQAASKTGPAPLAKVQQLPEEARGANSGSVASQEWWKQIAAFLGMPT